MKRQRVKRSPQNQQNERAALSSRAAHSILEPAQRAQEANQ